MATSMHFQREFFWRFFWLPMYNSFRLFFLFLSSALRKRTKNALLFCMLFSFFLLCFSTELMNQCVCASYSSLQLILVWVFAFICKYDLFSTSFLFAVHTFYFLLMFLILILNTHTLFSAVVWINFQWKAHTKSLWLIKIIKKIETYFEFQLFYNELKSILFFKKEVEQLNNSSVLYRSFFSVFAYDLFYGEKKKEERELKNNDTNSIVCKCYWKWLYALWWQYTAEEEEEEK